MSNASDNQLLSIYISGPYFQEVHDVKRKAEKVITPSDVGTKGMVGKMSKTLVAKGWSGGSGEAVGDLVSGFRIPCLFFSPAD